MGTVGSRFCRSRMFRCLIRLMARCLPGNSRIMLPLSSICGVSKFWTFLTKQPSTMPRFALRSKRVEQMICANDLFIAVHARSLKVTLVTNNTGEFGRVQDLDIENWAE